MRVNVYAEEQTDAVEIIEKDGFTGVRFWLHLPVTKCEEDPNYVGKTRTVQHQGPFMHHPKDDDSSAVTFWGKKDMRVALRKALTLLDNYYDQKNYSDSIVNAATAEDPINPRNSSDRETMLECIRISGGDLSKAKKMFDLVRKAE